MCGHRRSVRGGDRPDDRQAEAGEEVHPDDIRDCLSIPSQSRTPREPGSGPDALQSCLMQRDYHLAVSYQPADRYWPFQWLETSGLLVLAGLLSGLMLRRIPHVRG